MFMLDCVLCYSSAVYGKVRDGLGGEACWQHCWECRVQCGWWCGGGETAELSSCPPSESSECEGAGCSCKTEIALAHTSLCHGFVCRLP